MNSIFKYICVPTFIALHASSIYANEDIPTDNFLNKIISNTRADVSKGDLKTYNHPDRNLFIQWIDNSRGDGSPIRDADVYAKNITIISDFVGNQWTDKGVISDNTTNINASGDINITTYNDCVFTEGKGTTNISGFKNLNITSRSGFGLVDNGNGITIEGGYQSVVSIKSEYRTRSLWGFEMQVSRPAIGSHYLSENYGNGISIKSGMIKLDSVKNYSIYAGNGRKGRFEVNLDASEIDITGTIYGAGGNIAITPRTDGIMKISPSDQAEGRTLKDNSILLTNGSTLTINKDSAELKKMQITGKIDVSGEGSSLLANMTGDSSISSREGSSSTVAIEASKGGKVELNISGANSSISGDVQTGTGQNASITANLSGGSSRFTGNAEALGDFSGNNTINLSLSGDNAQQLGNLEAEGNNTLNAAYSGRNSSLTGTSDYTVDNKGIMNLSFSNQSVLNGDVLNGVKVYKENNSQPLKTFAGQLTANFDQAFWNGSLSNEGGTANITLNGGSIWTGKSAMSGTDAATNVSVNGGSTWKVTADSAVSTLKLSGGTVDLEGGAHQIKIGHISADGIPGTFRMDLTYHDNQRFTYENAEDSDFLYVGGGTGQTFRVEAADNSSLNGMREGDKLYFARTASGSAAFDVDHEVLVRNWDKIYNKTFRVKTEAVTAEAAAGGNTGTTASSGSVTGDSADTAASSGATAGDSAATTASSRAAAGAKARIAASSMAVASADGNADASSEAGTSVTENTAASAENNEDAWYLTPEITPLDNGFTPNANAYVPGSAHNAAASIWHDNDTLLKRLGELRWSKNNDGAWGRVINRKLARSGTQAFDVSMNTLQLGYDRRIPLSFGDIFVGGAIEHSRGTEKYDDGDGSVYMTDGALYGTFRGKSGDYVDVVTKAGKLFTHYSSDYGDGGDFENWGFSASAEYGRKFDLGWSWSVEPQAQIKYSYLWGDDYTSDNGAKIYQDDTDSLVGRLGLLVAKEFGTGTENPVRIYAKGSVLHEFLGDRDETLYQDIAIHDSTDLAGTWYSAGIGANIGLAENCSLYVDAERDFGTDIKVQYRIQGGFRFEF